MSDWFLSILLIVCGIFASCVYLSLRRVRAELFRHEASLQHERYRSRLVTDFLDAIEESYMPNGESTEISKEVIFRSLMRTAIRGTRAMSACIFRLENDSVLTPIANSGLFPFLEGLPPASDKLSQADLVRLYFHGDRYSKDSPPFKAAFETRHAQTIFTFPMRPNRIAFADAPATPRTAIVAPIERLGKMIGAIVVANPRHGGNFLPTEIELVDILAQQAGTALRMRDLLAVQSEKQRMDSELGVAASVQKLLLPQYIPQAHSIDIATTYRPAQIIGGDFYDVFDIGGGRIAAIIADVSGHGVPAALLMAICRTTFQQIARTAINAADLLRRLDRDVAKSFSRGKFLTIACAFLDTQCNTLSIARGGHERPLLLTTHDESGNELISPKLEFLDTRGLAIGISRPEIFDREITEISRPYFRDDVLVLYTDGLTEERNSYGEEFGSERLAAVVHRARRGNAKEINSAILKEVTAFSGKSEFSDDMTIVVIRAK
ncbi:MAG: SpoIIE family protein phosphatase [Opitutae bacterium]|nr:SpoIIE family protein phosphatase [Opitutae bacterium]